MPHLDTLVLFMAAALALNVTPGPDMLYVKCRCGVGGKSGDGMAPRESGDSHMAATLNGRCLSGLGMRLALVRDR